MGFSEQKFEQFIACIPEIEQALDYTFRKKALLIEAFVHRSFLNETKRALCSNERVEFLGDAVLGLFVASSLHDGFPDQSEGFLSKKKSYLVSRKSCMKMLKELNVASYLLVGKGEEAIAPSIAANLFEAIVGAVFLDGGWEAVERFLTRFRAYILSTLIPRNYKAELQEFLAKKAKLLPIYILEEEDLSARSPVFRVSVCIDGMKVAEAAGSTKQEAEQQAAASALKYIRGSSW